MEKARIEFDSTGETGNIYWILGRVRDALRKQRRITDYNNMWERVQKSGSYEQALEVIREYVDLVDTSGRH